MLQSTDSTPEKYPGLMFDWTVAVIFGLHYQSKSLTAPTSERLFRLLLLGLKRTSLKSSLRSTSTRGILDAQNADDQDEDDEYAEENPLRKAAAAVVAVGPKPQPPNPNLQAASVFIAKGGPAQPRPPWLYLGLDSLSLSVSLSPLLPFSLHSSSVLSLPPLLQQSGSSSSGQAGRQAWRIYTHTYTHSLAHTDMVALQWVVCCSAKEHTCCPVGALLP